MVSYNRSIPILLFCSAGTKASGKLNAIAVKAMAEIGIDFATTLPIRSKKYLTNEWDFVITACDDANENCSVFPGIVKHRLHIVFEDPSHATGTEEFIRGEFIRVRNKILEGFY